MIIETIKVERYENIEEVIKDLKLAINEQLLRKAEILKKNFGKIYLVTYKNDVINVISENEKIEVFVDNTRVATFFDFNEAKKYCTKNRSMITRIRYFLDGKLLEDCEPSVLFNI